jgi:hypothetical protein
MNFIEGGIHQVLGLRFGFLFSRKYSQIWEFSLKGDGKTTHNEKAGSVKKR